MAIRIGPLQPSGHYMYRQFNIQQFYVLPTVCLCFLYGSQTKPRLFPYTTLTDWFYITGTERLLRGTDWREYKCII